MNLSVRYLHSNVGIDLPKGLQSCKNILMKPTTLGLLLSVLLLSSTTLAQLISNAPSLPMTNALEIGPEIAEVVLEDLDEKDSDIETHLVLNTSSGKVRGVLRHIKSGRVFMFDSSGLLDLIIKRTSVGETLCVFDTNGKWLYTVKNNRYLFDANGQMKGVLQLSGDNVIFHRMDSGIKKNPAK